MREAACWWWPLGFLAPIGTLAFGWSMRRSETRPRAGAGGARAAWGGEAFRSGDAGFEPGRAARGDGAVDLVRRSGAPRSWRERAMFVSAVSHELRTRSPRCACTLRCWRRFGRPGAPAARIRESWSPRPRASPGLSRMSLEASRIGEGTPAGAPHARRSAPAVADAVAAMQRTPLGPQLRGHDRGGRVCAVMGVRRGGAADHRPNLLDNAFSGTRPTAPRGKRW